MRHFVIKRRYPHDTIETRLRRLLEENEDVFNRKVLQSIAFTELVTEMIDAVHRFDENDASSLGVQTVWVDEFPQIPEVLQKMRGQSQQAAAHGPGKAGAAPGQ
jgi:hypothetical protein